MNCWVQEGNIISKESSNETDDLAEFLDVQEDSMMSEESSNETDDLVESLNAQEGSTIFEESSNENDDLSKLLKIEENEHTKFDILENLIKGLKLFKIKDNYNISEAAFNEVLKVIEISEITLYQLEKYLENLVPLKPSLIDCCINSCIAFTGNFSNKNICSRYKEPCYKSDKVSKVSRKKAAYWSFINPFKLQYKDKSCAETLRYRYNYISTYSYILDKKIGNIFDGFRYKSLVSFGFFSDCRNVAIILSTDDIRVHRENLMISTIILGPKALKDFNSFLRPLVNKLKWLQNSVQCIDGITENIFTLCAHVLSLSGDLLALAKPPTGISEHWYDPKDLPLRTHENYARNAIAIEHMTRRLYKDEAKKRGLNGRSILFELNLIEFSISFPVDIMHRLFENVAPAMLQHWSGTFFKDSQISNTDYILFNSDWTKIGNTMESNRKSGIIFVTTFTRLSSRKATWQYPIERMCGMLLPLVHSRQHLYTNFWNQITTWIHFSHLQDKAEIKQKLFDSSLKILNYSENCVFITDNSQEILYSLLYKYCMNKPKLQHLKAYYIKALEINMNQLLAKLMVDRNAHHRNAPVILEEKEFFGELSEYELLKFRDLGAFEVINISAICRSVRFFRLSNNEPYIID
ncbi:4527_t:CDS:10 [Gigaspora margarita]|uniref:4527_t:CDS:1 n=1 Tax=Gigaspora margarita TaxID=4874 RepID=A0ABN7V866_GIGMA|nr:4527_t:CDS:10 [Gigaspora margarita]